jgi:hypothetical protein
LSNFLPTDESFAFSEPGTNGHRNWITGNNQWGISEIAERFQGIAQGSLSGVAIGIARKYPVNGNSDLIVRIYEGNDFPEVALNQFRFPMKNLLGNAMNYLGFAKPVPVSGNFFIGFEILSEKDSLVFFHSKSRPVALSNSLLFNKNGVWKTSAELLMQTDANMALLVQPNVCSIVQSQKSDSVIDATPFVTAYPVPAFNELKIEFKKQERWVNFQLFDLLGKKVYAFRTENSRYAIIDLSGFVPGIYFLHSQGENEKSVQRVVLGAK